MEICPLLLQTPLDFIEIMSARRREAKNEENLTFNSITKKKKSKKLLVKRRKLKSKFSRPVRWKMKTANETKKKCL